MLSDAGWVGGDVPRKSLRMNGTWYLSWRERLGRVAETYIARAIPMKLPGQSMVRESSEELDMWHRVCCLLSSYAFQEGRLAEWPSVLEQGGGSSAGVCMLIACCREVKWMPWTRMQCEGALSKGVLGTAIRDCRLWRGTEIRTQNIIWIVYFLPAFPPTS